MNRIASMVNNMTIKQRADNRYEGRMTIKGNRKSFYGNSKSEVKRGAKEYLLKIENGFVEPRKIRLNEYIEYWLFKYKWGFIESSSYTRLYSTYIHQVKDTIGRKCIGTITTEDIQELINGYANPQTKEEKALAKSGLKRLKDLLNACLEKAVEEGVISVNPCKNVKIPTSSYIQKETRTQRALSDWELDEFKKAALSIYKSTGEYKCRDGLVLLIILNLGIRVGEALALEWDDVDLDKKMICIDKTIQSNTMKKKDDLKSITVKLKKTTKTSAGVRTLKLNDTVCWYFEELKKYDATHNINTSFVCATHANTRQSARNLQRSLDRIVSWTQIEDHITLHTLRHTFGSVMLRRGTPIEVVSKLMGHANINITFNKYIHVLKEQQAKAMEMIVVD